MFILYLIIINFNHFDSSGIPGFSVIEDLLGNLTRAEFTMSF